MDVSHGRIRIEYRNGKSTIPMYVTNRRKILDQ